MSNWRTIDSAPKDEDEEIWLIVWNGKTVCPATWVDSFEYTGWAYATSSWGGTLYDGYNQMEPQPTRWQPLPAPPEPSSDT